MIALFDIWIIHDADEINALIIASYVKTAGHSYTVLVLISLIYVIRK